MKITAYRDSNGKIHDNKIDCEISDLKKELELESDGVLLAEEVLFLIEQGKKAQRLKKLYESRESRTDNK